MAFKLPRLSELTESQRNIVNLPLEKSCLVVGAPGTGKSVLAIYRASDMSNAGLDVLMLVYNRPLMSYIASAVEKLDIDAEVNTWQSWIANFYLDNFKASYPKMGGKFTYDWSKIKLDFRKLGKVYDHVILDEAQDVPIELIEALKIISNGVSCFMDRNQTLEGQFVEYQEVCQVLGTRSPYLLTENFRNTREIFDFARLYNSEANEVTTKSNGIKPVMIKCSGYGSWKGTQLTSRMVQVIKRNFGLNSIGVFTNAKSLNRTYEELVENLDDTDIYMYKSGTKDFSTIDFENPGVYVLSFNCMKGLEFDAVLIPRCECITAPEDSDVGRNKFYVAVTRASEQVYCFYFNEASSDKYFDTFGPIKGNEDMLNWE